MRAVAPGTHGVLWVNDLAEMECLRCLQAGARGIVKKTQPVSVLLECLRTVVSGSLWLEQSIARPSQTFAAKRTTPRFTPREQEIVHHVCRGLKNKEIAESLKITPGTVKVHLMHIFEKAGVRDRFELALQGTKLVGAAQESIAVQVAVAPPA
jgi:DNA-binding NarL/FixJ family response regulator